jgi:hypothetical protein
VKRHRASKAWIAFVALGAASCGGDPVSVSPDTRQLGTLVHAWTIDGGTEASACERYGADQLRLVLYEPDGNFSATALEPCESFEARKLLVAQTYHGIVAFLGRDGVEVSETLSLGEITVEPDAETRSSIDFGDAVMRPAR